MAQIRGQIPYAAVCIDGLVTVLASSPGGAKVDGGTQYNGNYYMADSTGELISVFKSKKTGPAGLDPVRGDNVNVTAGKFEVFPLDAGGTQQISGDNLALAAGSPATGTVPSPQSVNASDIAKGSFNPSMVGKYVTVPIGSYTADAMPTEFTYTSSTGKTYYDGVALTDGSSNRILVDTFTFEYSAGSCFPSDGGQPDLSAGGFNGVFDIEQTSDGAINGVVFYGSCGM